MISIVMSFYNRQYQLDKTIESIKRSRIKDYELIIVDDASNPPLVCDEAVIVRLLQGDKWYHNPCIPFNIGFSKVTGEKVIIQSPECYHMGDVLSYVDANLTSKHYLSFACYALNPDDTERLHNGNTLMTEDRRYRHPENNGWYNHSKHRPVAYHFCSAIMRRDLEMLGGFDERYASGISYDDDDFIRRIKKRGMKVKIIDDPFVFHQYHPPFTYQKDGYMRLHKINKDLFNSTR